MAQWDGRGLPPVAAARVERARSSGLWTSLLSTPAAGSLQTVGLDPVGEVMGCVVEQVGWQGGGCGAGYGFGFVSAPSVVMGSRDGRWAGFGPYAEAVRRGYATALSRLLQEVRALGADGVVGVRLTLSMLDGAREFMALGTAVRARSSVRPATPFLTDLAGSEVAKLMQGGWVPAALLVAFEVAIRHDDWRTSGQASSWANVEVSGYTELTQYVRHTVRADIASQVARVGADGFVASRIGLRIFDVEPGEGHRDHVAEALMTGTALAQFGPGRRRGASPTLGPPATRTLSVLPLNSSTPVRERRR